MPETTAMSADVALASIRLKIAALQNALTTMSDDSPLSAFLRDMVDCYERAAMVIDCGLPLPAIKASLARVGIAANRDKRWPEFVAYSDALVTLDGQTMGGLRV